MDIHVNEIFYSLQGEGSLAGVPSIFIRLAGCPLRCRWCDTKYAWDETAGTEMSLTQIPDKISEYPTRYVVITGGEPMMHDGIGELTGLLQRHHYHITIETAGINNPADVSADLMSISPKLDNSLPDDPQQSAEHKQRCLRPEIVRDLMNGFDYQLKFVVEKPDDLNEVAGFINEIGAVDPYKIYLMPQATEPKDYLKKSRWLAEFCLQTGFSFSPRLQVMLWSGQRGK